MLFITNPTSEGLKLSCKKYSIFRPKATRSI